MACHQIKWLLGLMDGARTIPLQQRHLFCNYQFQLILLHVLLNYRVFPTQLVHSACTIASLLLSLGLEHLVETSEG